MFNKSKNLREKNWRVNHNSFSSDEKVSGTIHELSCEESCPILSSEGATLIPEDPFLTDQNLKIICRNCSVIVSLYISLDVKMLKGYLDFYEKEKIFKCSKCSSTLGNFFISEDHNIEVEFNSEKIGFEILDDFFSRFIKNCEIKKKTVVLMKKINGIENFVEKVDREINKFKRFGKKTAEILKKGSPNLETS